MALHGPLITAFREKTSTNQFALQNARLLKVQMGYGPVWCLSGSMVAYQGDLRFEKKSEGVSRFLKSAVTGEGVDLMMASGQGEMFLATHSAEVQVIYLENDMISVNGANILAFSSSIEWDVQMVKGAGAFMGGSGLFNVTLRGSGYVALTTEGEAVALDVASAPTVGDPQAVVMWTGGVRMDLKMDSGGLGSLLRGGSGETFQMAFSGQGYVLIQPSEGQPLPVAEKASGGSLLGNLVDLAD